MFDCNDIAAVERVMRYETLSSEKKKKIDTYQSISSDIYQLYEIKRKRPKLNRGDIFLLNPCENIYLYGAVLNCNVNRLNYGKDLVVICIFKASTNSLDAKTELPLLSSENILLGPILTVKTYWNNGYFYNIGNAAEAVSDIKYGFYKSAFKKENCKIINEFGEVMSEKPQLLNSDGLTTMTGVAYHVHYELIIDHSFLSLEDQRTYETYLEEMLKPQMAEEKVLSEFDKEILPFSLFKEHSRRYGIILEDFEPYAGIFRQRSDELEGNGYDWEDLIKYYLKVNFPETYKRIKFDSEAGMLYMYASNETLMKEVVQKLALELKHNRMIEYVMKAKFSDLLDD